MDSGSPERKIAALNDAQISYLDCGQGQAIVLLHGIGSAAASWRDQFAGLAETFRVLAWDAPGYGESTALTQPAPNAGDYAARLAAFLAAMKLARFHLVGHSLGALIAARFAAERPEQILTLTLASVASGHARLPAEERARLMQGRVDDITKLGPRGMAEKRGPRLVSATTAEEVRRAVIETMAAVRPDGYLQAVRMLSQGDVRADIARLPAAMPVQIVFGDADIITTPEANRLAAAEKPGAPIRVIADAGHAVYLEKPDQFNEILAAFAAEGATRDAAIR
jgi:pimeloyl-ACP methyl ester carboxylesterase